MTEVCTCRTIAPSGWDRVQQVVDPTCPLHATYTAAEVKVLTEAALRLGRKEAGEEIADAIEMKRRIGRPLPISSLAELLPSPYRVYTECAEIARVVASQPSPDATNARTEARECPGCGQDGTGLESHNRDCPRNPYSEAASGQSQPSGYSDLPQDPQAVREAP